MGRKRVKCNRIEKVLKEEGKNLDWLTNEAKVKFKWNKKLTFSFVKDNLPLTLNDKFVYASCLKISYQRFN